MAASVVAVCNDALILCGAERITSLSDNNNRARLCNEQYERARDQLLVSHPWNFAMKRQTLAPLSDLPSGWEDNPDYSYAFNLPNDCLRVWEIDDDDADWDVESGKLFTTYTPVVIKYISKVTETGKFSANFDEVLALCIAEKIAYSLTQSATFVQTVTTMKEEAIRRARSYDAQEASSKETDADDFLKARL